MKKSTLTIAMLMEIFLVTPCIAEQAIAKEGMTVFASGGARIGRVHRVRDDGTLSVIVDDAYKLVKIPLSTLSTINGKLTTTLSKKEALSSN